MGVNTSSVHCEAYSLWLAGKAVGITVAGLLAGVLLGAALQSWLRVDIVPIAVSLLCLTCPKRQQVHELGLPCLPWLYLSFSSGGPLAGVAGLSVMISTQGWVHLVLFTPSVRQSGAAVARTL